MSKISLITKPFVRCDVLESYKRIVEFKISYYEL